MWCSTLSWNGCAPWRHAVHVEVVGRLGARDEVRFSFEDQRSASDQAWTVECWRRAGTRLTYVHLDGQGILLDDASWFAGAIGAGPHQAR